MATIRSIRLLPPFAIARLGSGEQPMDNYTLEPDGDADGPLAYRKLKARPSFVVEANVAGEVEIVAVKPPAEPLSFKEKAADGTVHIRPVAPFLEAFAEIEGEPHLVPLTESRLKDSGFELADVKWSVCVGNRKVARRTQDEADAVIALANDIRHHKWVPLEGRCAHFSNPATDSIDFGKVAFVKPTAEHPEIRLRFHPAKGLIYGPAPDPDRPAPADDDPFDANLERFDIPDARAIYKNPASARHAKDPPDKPTFRGWFGLDAQKIADAHEFYNETLPPALFAIEPPAPNWLFDNVAVSRGYLDDACDGFVEIRIERGEKRLSAIARVCAGPPATAPDSLFVRSLADDLDQALLGPEVDAAEPAEAMRARALDIVRRAFETVSFMNVAVMNGNAVAGRPALILDSMPEEEAADTERMIRPVMAPTSVDTFAIKMLHQQAYAAMLGGAAPWFARLLRRPDEVADYTDFGRRKMPALMCGADNSYLALTWRQISTIERIAAAGPSAMGKAAHPLAPESRDGLSLTPLNLSAQIRHPIAGNPVSTLPVTAVANCCPGLEVDFRAVWRRLFKGVELREYDNLVVRLWPDPRLPAPPPERAELEPVEPFVDFKCVDGKHDLSRLPGHRLLRVRLPDANGKPGEAVPVIARMKGPATSDLDGKIDLTTSTNPHGVAPLEWSNALAPVLDYARRTARKGETPFVFCDFSEGKHWSEHHQPLDLPGPNYLTFRLEVRPFFEDDTAVVSRALARAGELTQGLCSPWQNDYRECSCYYWASARPDFVNVETDTSGLSVGDNWMSRERSGRYIADDYKDGRLMMYDELFRDWETKLKFEIGGRDLPDPK